MTSKEFTELVFNSALKDMSVDNQVIIDKYIVDNIGQQNFNDISGYLAINNPVISEVGTMEKTADKYTQDQVDNIEKLLSNMPADIKFYYYRHFFLDDQLRTFINEDEDGLKEIVNLRQMKIDGIN